MSFPDHYPDQCPPSDCVEPEEELLYRLVNDPITEENLKSHYELEKANSDSCEARSVSMSTTTNRLDRLRSSYEGMSDLKIAKLHPQKHWGLMKHGKKKGKQGAHVDMWLYEQTDRSEIIPFMEIVAEDAN